MSTDKIKQEIRQFLDEHIDEFAQILLAELGKNQSDTVPSLKTGIAQRWHVLMLDKLLIDELQTIFISSYKTEEAFIGASNYIKECSATLKEKVEYFIKDFHNDLNLSREQMMDIVLRVEDNQGIEEKWLGWRVNKHFVDPAPFLDTHFDNSIVGFEELINKLGCAPAPSVLTSLREWDEAMLRAADAHTLTNGRGNTTELMIKEANIAREHFLKDCGVSKKSKVNGQILQLMTERHMELGTMWEGWKFIQANCADLLALPATANADPELLRNMRAKVERTLIDEIQISNYSKYIEETDHRQRSPSITGASLIQHRIEVADRRSEFTMFLNQNAAHIDLRKIAERAAIRWEKMQK